MITLSPDAHCMWAHGLFTSEPMGAEANNPHELRVRVKWTPRHSENPKEVGIAADSTSMELIPLRNGEALFDLESFSPISGKVSRIVDGHIVTFRSNDLLNALLPNRNLFMAAMLLSPCCAWLVGIVRTCWRHLVRTTRPFLLLRVTLVQKSKKSLNLLSQLPTMMGQLI